jgi:hypothetical protein
MYLHETHRLMVCCACQMRMNMWGRRLKRTEKQRRIRRCQSHWSKRKKRGEGRRWRKSKRRIGC